VQALSGTVETDVPGVFAVGDLRQCRRPRPTKNIHVNETLTAREQGLIAGHAYASRYRGDRAKLRPIVAARTANEVKANVDSTIIAPCALDSPVAFWSGFAHGVAAFLVEDGAHALP